MINWSNTSNFLIAAFYGICAIFSFLFIFDAYNHAGQGIVMFRNVDDSTNIVNEADRKNRYSGMFVGFDEACVTKPGASGVSYNDCYKLTPSQDRDLHIIVPITWILLGFAVAHYVLKYVHERDSFKPMFKHDTFKVIAFFLFAGPIALFIVSVIWWEYFIQRSQTIVPYKNGEDDHVLNSGGAGEFNSVADSYKDTEYWGSGMTNYVWLLLIGQLLQALACIMVLVRNIVMKDNKTFLSFFVIDEEAFGDKLKDILSNASVGAPVDAAAKKPETKAAAQAQVTSVYANRRVTNGISF